MVDRKIDCHCSVQEHFLFCCSCHACVEQWPAVPGLGGRRGDKKVSDGQISESIIKH